MASICDLTHARQRCSPPRLPSMEWVLQVADEFDDAIGVLRHGWLGVTGELSAVSLAGLGVGAELAGPALGAQPAILGAAAVAANLAALIKIRQSRRSA